MFPALSIVDELDSQAVSALENTPRIFILHNPSKTSKPNIHLPSRYNNVHVDTTSLACVTSGNRSETTSVMFLRSEVFETSGMSSESKSLTLLNWKCSCKMPCMTEGSSEFCHFQVSYLQIVARQGVSKLTLSNVLLNPRSRFAL